MLKSSILLGLICLTTSVIGGVLGLFTAKLETITVEEWGTVPAHMCIVKNGYYCGIFEHPEGGFVEISSRGLPWDVDIVGYRKTNGYTDYNASIFKRVQHKPSPLTLAEVDKAFRSQRELRDKRSFENAHEASAVGLTIGLLISLALAIYAVLPSVIRFLRSTGRRARNIGRSVGDMAGSVQEQAALRAEVRKSELLVRKAIAEAKLQQDDPDTIRHAVRLERQRN